MGGTIQMLNDTKKELTLEARKLIKPYEDYSIDELADAYCDAVDVGNETLKNIYISALILRFWHKIDKMYKANTVAPCLEHEDFFWWLYEAIEYACKYRGWKDETKKLNAQQCINKCIDTIKLQKYYNLRLDKNKTVNYCTSIDAPIGDGSEDAKTLSEILESEEPVYDHSTDNVMSLVQSYINNNKVIEAILIDNIAFNDVQKHFKKVIKTTDASGEIVRYTEHSSEFWAYRLVQIISKLPATYKNSFMKRYDISEEKLTTVLDALDKVNKEMLALKRECDGEYKLVSQISKLELALLRLDNVMAKFLDENKKFDNRDIILELYFNVKNFLNTCERKLRAENESGNIEFFKFYNYEKILLKQK